MTTKKATARKPPSPAIAKRVERLEKALEILVSRPGDDAHESTQDALTDLTNRFTATRRMLRETK